MWLCFEANFSKNNYFNLVRIFKNSRKSIQLQFVSPQPQETDNLESRAVLTESLCYVEIYRATQNTGNGFKRNIAFPKGNKLSVGGFFLLIWMKQTLIWFNLQRDGTEIGLSNIKDTFAESFQLKMSVLHQSMDAKVCASSRLVSRVKFI